MKKVVRQIPGKVVQRELKKRVAEYFEKEGKSATKSMKTDMKHDIIEDLSVSAFKLDSYIDVIFTDDFVIVGAGSAKAADDVFTSMRKCFGTLQAVCLGAATKNAMSPVVTKDIHAALLNEESEEIKSLGFDVGDAIGLEGSGQWGGKDIALDSGVLLAAFDANMSVGKAQLCGDDLHFDLTEELHMKAIGFSNVMQFQAIENTEDQTQQIETNITLAYAAITAAVMKVVDGLGGWYDEEQS
ncbi:DNA recombination-dependent growth factor C [Vibrio phage 82E32.1]|nr:DNA recombination-dependent growth factor C [Vibrio phage 82E32.1]